nr:unnamed protein product [Callosobruchus analis]
MRGYLANRKQQIIYNGQLSECAEIRHGVSQGSILGALLFLIYVNDIQTASSCARIMLLADDASVIRRNQGL